MRALVTGGAGFIGSHLVRCLLKEGWAVTVLDDLTTGDRSNLPVSPRLTFHHGSVEIPSDIASACKNVDCVYHLAAVVGVRLAFADCRRAYRIATVGTQLLLQHAGSARVVVFSSSCVYGYAHDGPVRESMVCEAQCLAVDGGSPGYACGKLEMEREALRRSRSVQRTLVVRPFNVVGPGQRSTYGMVLPTFIEQARHGEHLLVYDDGRQTRSFSDVSTFTRTVVRLAQRRAAFVPGQNVVNVGRPVATPVLELARAVIQEISSSSTIQFVPYERVFPGRSDIRHRLPDVGRLTSYLGVVRWQGLRSIIRASSSFPAIAQHESRLPTFDRDRATESTDASVS